MKILLLALLMINWFHFFFYFFNIVLNTAFAATVLSAVIVHIFRSDFIFDGMTKLRTTFMGK